MLETNAGSRASPVADGRNEPFHSPVTQVQSGQGRTGLAASTILKLPNWTLQHTPPSKGDYFLFFFAKKRQQRLLFSTSHDKPCQDQCYAQQLVIWEGKRELNHLFLLLLFFLFFVFIFNYCNIFWYPEGRYVLYSSTLAGQKKSTCRQH